MCPEALGVALRVAKHLGTILTSLETVWDNLKKIEKNRFFPSNFLKSLAVLSFASGNFLTGYPLCDHIFNRSRLTALCYKSKLHSSVIIWCVMAILQFSVPRNQMFLDFPEFEENRKKSIFSIIFLEISGCFVVCLR